MSLYDIISGINDNFCNWRYTKGRRPSSANSRDKSMYDGWFTSFETKDNTNFQILIQVEDWDFVSLPNVYVKAPLPDYIQNLLPLAHFSIDKREYKGDWYYSVCYSLHDAYELKISDPLGVLGWVLDKTKIIIEALIKNKRHRSDEFLRELTPIWQSIASYHSSNLIKSNDAAVQSIHDLLLPVIYDLKQGWHLVPWIVKDGHIEANTLIIHIPSKQLAKIPSMPSVFIDVKSSKGIPLKYFLLWLKQWSHVAFRLIVSEIASNIERHRETTLYFPVCLVVDKQLLSLCIELENLKELVSGSASKHLKLANHSKLLSNSKVVFSSAVNLTPNFLFTRNLDNLEQPNLIGKNIALLGCGAIGGYLGLSLARLGAGASGGKLTLIDSDIFQEENIGRHALGKAYLHRMKASALKQEIAQQIPDLNIEVHNINACNRSILKNISNYDLIIDATAKIEASETINKFFFDSDGKTPPLIHSWIRGNGECVQALYNDKNTNYACRSCINKSGNSIREEYDALKGMTATRSFMACADFTPFAVSASMSAAALTIDMILDWLQGDVSPRYRTRYTEKWMGEKIESKDYAPSLECHICKIN